VLDHLTDEQKPLVAKKLNAAYGTEDHAAAKLALTQLHRELMDLNLQCGAKFGGRPGGNAGIEVISANAGWVQASWWPRSNSAASKDIN
jgi:hypothetical protein